MRDGARVKKRYHPAATPLQRLLADERVAAEIKERARAIHAKLEPVALLREMRAAQQHLVEIADKTLADDSKPTTPTLEQFLSGLRTAWREGEVRPTARPHPNPSACAVDRIHLRQLMVSCANASRPSHGGRRGSHSSVCSGMPRRLSGQATADAAAAGESVAVDNGAENDLRSLSRNSR
jgi:hypothetical protein